MTPEQLARAGAAVSERIDRCGLSVTDAARAMSIDRKTLNALISGNRWPRVAVRNRIEDAIRWPRGEVARRAAGGVDSLRGYSERDLLAELSWRTEQRADIARRKQ